MTKEVQLSADPKIRLQTYDQHPPTLEVQLFSVPKSPGVWKLKVTIPPNSFSGSFSETDGVILQIVGTKRFIRIPIEGNVIGR